MTAPTSNTIPPATWLKGARGLSEYSGVSFRTAQKWIASGRLHVKRLSPRLLLVKASDVDSFIEDESERYEEAAL